MPSFFFLLCECDKLFPNASLSHGALLRRWMTNLSLLCSISFIHPEKIPERDFYRPEQDEIGWEIVFVVFFLGILPLLSYAK